MTTITSDLDDVAARVARILYKQDSTLDFSTTHPAVQGLYMDTARLVVAEIAGSMHEKLSAMAADLQSASEYIKRLEISLMEAEASDLYNVGDTVRVVGSRYDSYVFDDVIVDRDITDAEGKPYLVQTTDGKKRWCWANETKLVRAGGPL